MSIERRVRQAFRWGLDQFDVDDVCGQLELSSTIKLAFRCAQHRIEKTKIWVPGSKRGIEGKFDESIGGARAFVLGQQMKSDAVAIDEQIDDELAAFGGHT